MCSVAKQPWNVVLSTVLLWLCMWTVGGERDCSIDKDGLPSDTCSFDLKMRGAQPNRADQYYCTGYHVQDDILGEPGNKRAEGYIVKYEALADAGVAHHILVFGCRGLRHNIGDIWHCGQVCEDDHIIFAWAKNAPPLTLPKNVGQHIGGNTRINYIVVQIHYAAKLPSPDTSGIRIYATKQRQPYIAGIYLLLAYGVTIPANTKKFHIDSSCTFNWEDSIVPFGFRTHAHSLGQVISGYKVDGSEYTQIGKGNPQWPQAFYPVEKPVTVNPGDVLAARCTFDSSGRNRVTHIGETANDEMCNFYIMYYMNATMEGRRRHDTCANVEVPHVFSSPNFPADSDTPLPPNPALEEAASGHHHHHAMTNNDDDSLVEPTPPARVTPTTAPRAPGTKLDPRLGLEFESNVSGIVIGQVGGLAVSQEGELHIFHRGDNIWSSLSFDRLNRYMEQNRPVEVDTVVILHRNGTLKRSFGKNWFFLPHGLTVDSRGNLWVTDVALHQVFRVPAGTDRADMTLGMRFEPGSDTEHFCKPTDVAVLASGDFFVSDGYCNSRIMKFDRNGYFVKQFGSTSSSYGADGFPPAATFFLPHGLALAEDKGLLCVADRENGRIQCFDLDGKFVRQMHPPQFGRALYAVEYCPNHGGLLFAVNGPDDQGSGVETQGLTLNINTGDLVSVWNVPKVGLTHPHDVAVDTVDHVVYVGELNPPKVWKFRMDKALYAGATSKTAAPPAAGEAHTPAPKLPLPSHPGTDSSHKQTAVPDQPAGADNKSPAVAPSSDVTADHTDAESRSEEDMGPSLVIGAMLVIPIVLLVVIAVLVRLYHTGYLAYCCRGHGRQPIFNIGNFLNSHKGFDRLSTEDDDHDLENALDDSDNEEFSITRKA